MLSIDLDQYYIFRTYSSGVFAGYILEKEKEEVKVKKAKRIWYWDGAASLSQLAQEGTKKPDQCKFAVEVDEIILINVIEILKVTPEAENSIKSVKVWAVK